jgi:hypothetical protein
MAGKATEDRIRTLRSAVLMFVESVVVLDAAASQIAADSLRSQIDEVVASRFNLARLEMLSEFGPEAVMRTLLEQILRPPEQLGGIAPGLSAIRFSPGVNSHRQFPASGSRGAYKYR